MPSRLLKVFSELVDDDADIEGIIAYGLFTIEQKEWVEKFKTDNNGRAPTSTDYDAFIATYNQSRLGRLEGEARGVLSDFALTLFEQARKQDNQRAINLSILSEVKKQNSFWLHAIASGVGAFGFTVIFILFIAIAVYDVSLTDIVTRVFGKP